MNQPRRLFLTCPRCGSSDSQMRDVAFAQAHRRTDGGYQSISEFGQSVAPPQREPVFWGPFLIGVGAGCTAMFVRAYLIAETPGLESSLRHLFDPTALRWGLAAGLLAFVIRSATAIAHNQVVWTEQYKKWKTGAVCRRCGHQYRVSPSRNRRPGGSDNE